MATQSRTGLLGPDDPAPVITLNIDRPSPFLLIGDHAGNAIATRLGTLGLSEAERARHIACDIGVRGLGEALARRLDCTFLHQAYSRLVIDCNRDPVCDEAIPERSDGTDIPGNIGIDGAERAARIAEIHQRYQEAIAAEIDRRQAIGQPAILVSLHSFTPELMMQGTGHRARPWHVGVLHGFGKAAFAKAVLARLRREADLVVGDNQPYRMDETDHTVPRHAFAAGLPYVELEVRQDLIADLAGQIHWAELLATAMTQAEV